MSSRPLNPAKLKSLQPATALWDLYRPDKAPLRFQARTAAAARRWQQATRKALREALGFTRLTPAPLAPRRLEAVDRGDFVREKILLRTSRHTLMPVYLLLPRKAPRPLPVVIAFHGHGYGVKDIVGLWEDGAERLTPDGYHKDFAIALCRRGFAVAAPEISCFGERQSVLGPHSGGVSTCTHTATLAFHLGGSAVGLRVHDGLKLVDYLATRKDLDTRRLGAMGISGGGLHTLFSTCADPRIKACVISGYFCTFRACIFAMHHCACNYVPNLHRFGEMYDLAALIAPRPVLIEAADHDPIFPLPAVKQAVARLRAEYGVFDAADRVQTDYFEGRHQISGRRAYDFLCHTLAP
jgi:dienelactone hydrolase